jgi:uncharacterized protein YndB with AHSA1/START domain
MTDPASRGRWLGDVELRVRAEEPERLLELDWGTGAEPSFVRIELTETEEGTTLVLDHTLLAEPQGMAAIRSWVEALARLEASLGGGE